MVTVKEQLQRLVNSLTKNQTEELKRIEKAQEKMKQATDAAKTSKTPKA